jgi:hypothetical protein
MGGVAYRRRISNDPPESSFPLRFCAHASSNRPLELSLLQKRTIPAAILSENHD